MTLRMNITTFIKIASLDGPKQFKEIGNLLDENKGYSYYRTLTSAIKSLVALPEVAPSFSIFESCGTKAEKTYNIAAFNSFLKWKERKSRTFIEDDAKESKFFSAYDIEIWCDPTFFYVEDNVLYTALIWPTQSPDLRQAYAGMALQLVKDIYAGTRIDNYKVGLLDLSSEKPKYFSEKRIGDLTPLLLENELANISRIARLIANDAA